MKKALNLINTLDTDFKAITRVAEMLEHGDIKSGEVVILPVGSKRSAYAKDISGYASYYAESMLKDCLVVEVNREGLYDMLPEGLFHATPARGASLSESEMMHEIQLRRGEEKDARKFFMPFEAELNHMRTLLEWYENRLDKKTSYNDLAEVFAAEWPEFSQLDSDQKIIWMHLLPFIHQKRNNLFFLGQLLSVLFNIQVEVVLSASTFAELPIAEELQFKMGGGALGTDTVIGSSFLSDQEEIMIYIGPADSSRLVSFLPGTAHALLLDKVISYLVPVETAVKIEMITPQEEKTGSLGSHSAHTFLGFTVYL